jgi:flavin-dependent dehydrogenase
MEQAHYDVVVIGAGVAGLTLARHLLLDSAKSILLLERRPEIPLKRQKVGESSVQVSGYYLGKVLDLEEYLLHGQLLKYNLRFHYKRDGCSNASFEDYCVSYIRTYSNLPTYQLDRNTLEEQLLRMNVASDRFRFVAPATDLDVALSQSDDAPHQLRFLNNGVEERATAAWVVDTSGRSKFIARQNNLKRENPIDHGSSFCWVDGLVNLEKLTDLTLTQSRLRRDRHSIGSSPFWLATNHFVGEGFWFWVIPLRHKTSLGLVYDRKRVDENEVNTPDKLIRWVCREFPLFERDLPRRKVLDWGYLRDYSYDCAQTISPRRWALSGEAGRFSDPLYSPGGDLISLYNTMIVDAIKTDDPIQLRLKARFYEGMMRAFYEAYVPSFSTGYDALGDQECFVMKYTWELAVYFSFYVLPFINDLFTDVKFLPHFLPKFSKLGPVNKTLQSLITAYHHWKKRERVPPSEKTFFDFYEILPLKNAETLFYRIGLTREEAAQILQRQLDIVVEYGKLIVAHIASQVLDEPDIAYSREFFDRVDLATIEFDEAKFRMIWDACPRGGDPYMSCVDPCVFDRFRTAMRPQLVLAAGD